MTQRAGGHAWGGRFLFAGLTVIVSTAPGAFPAHADEARALQLSASRSSYNLTPFVDVLEDRDRVMGIEQAAAPKLAVRYRPVNADVLNLGISNSVYWVRFTIEADKSLSGPQPLGQEWLLHVGWWNISLAQLYIPEFAPDGRFEKWIVQEAGVPKAYDSASMLRRHLVFRLPTEWSRPLTLYLRVESETVLFLPLEVATSQTFLEESKRQSLLLGIYYGLILAMVIYNLVLYVSLQDRNYLWYVLYVSFLGLYFLGINGILHEYLFPGLTGGALLRLDLSFLGLALFGTGLFTRSFLLTQRNAPLADRFLLVYTTVAGCLVAFSPFAGSGAVKYYALFGQVATFIPIGAGLICWRRGFRPARFFLLAWTIFTAGGIVYALTWSNVLPFNMWTLHSFQISSALEALILSLALGDRVRILRWEREEARKRERRYMELAITDGLTNLFNARYFRSHIAPEIERAESIEQPIALLMIDVDDFKLYNDTHGHPEGDKVLSTLGQVVLTSVRDNDLPCRYGGEEFAIILPGSTGNVAVEIAERIRATFAAKTFVPRENVAVHVTISVGVAQHKSGEDAVALLARADKALYAAKGQGKDRIMLAE